MGWAGLTLLCESAGCLATCAQICGVDESAGSGWFSDLVIVCGHVGDLTSGRPTLTFLAFVAVCCPQEPRPPWKTRVPSSSRAGGHGCASQSKQGCVV